MKSRKFEDLKRAKRALWWVEPNRLKYFAKCRKKCSCFSCGNPRRTKLSSPKGLKEDSLLLFHQDEINEALSYGQNY